MGVPVTGIVNLGITREYEADCTRAHFQVELGISSFKCPVMSQTDRSSLEVWAGIRRKLNRPRKGMVVLT